MNELSFHSRIDNNSRKRPREENEIEPVKNKQFRFIRDRYTDARGEPKMLEITCRKCHAWLIDYQKDGSGELLRCYADRIYHPSSLRRHVFTNKTVRDEKPLKCSKCSSKWAIPFIYQRKHPLPETRPAYRILKDSEGWLIDKKERKK